VVLCRIKLETTTTANSCKKSYKFDYLEEITAFPRQRLLLMFYFLWSPGINGIVVDAFIA
jgi:hypothetical protein